ncbi:MAG: DUF4340 domain-containing protein [Bacteriovoracaceae bacterium]
MRSYLKPQLSTVLVAFFFFILLFLGLFAEVFENETPEVDLAQIYANPVPVAELQHLKSMKISNKQGEFDLLNQHPEGNLEGPWQMTAPQALVVKAEVISKIIEAFNVIRVRNFHRLEPINITSYSLDNPTLTLLFTNFRDRKFEIKMGLINPIDNSAYMTISTQNQIYQIDPLEIQLESYDLAQLVESKILALNVDSLVSLEIYGEAGLLLKLLKKEDKWLGEGGVELAGAKVTKFLERLEAIKSTSILENLTGEQKEVMDRATAVPHYSLKLITNQGVRTYVIGEVKGGIPGTSINGNVYALSGEERKSYVLIDKDQLKVFGTKQNELK